MSEPSTPAILVVDDNEANRYAISRSLERVGFRVRQASAGLEALRLLEERPALVVLDVRLPDLDGFEVCRRIKADPATASLPVLQISAQFTRSADRAFGLEGGADGYLVAPIDPDELVAAVRALLRIRRAEEEARAVARQWQAMLDAIADGVCLLDPAGRVQRCNRALADILRRPADQIVGRSPAELGLSWPARAGDTPGRKSVEQELGGHWYRLTIDPVPGEAGGPAGAIGILADVTDRRRADEAIRKLNEDLERRVAARTAELQAANDELEAFAYSVSHDLRSPLRALDGFSRILLEEHAAALPREAREYLQGVRGNAQKMGRLIDDLLQFSRLGRQFIDKQLVSPADLVRQALTELRSEQEGRSVEIVIGTLPPCEGDPALLQQVWLNLLSNALKYTRKQPAARIEISGEACRGPDGEECVYRVRDNGAGFDMKYARRLFGVFQRLHPARDYEGTGVGLAIVQRIVHRHGGHVWAEAAVNEGATFSFALPCGGRPKEG
jgi:signal transduction histidine kinase